MDLAKGFVRCVVLPGLGNLSHLRGAVVKSHREIVDAGVIFRILHGFGFIEFLLGNRETIKMNIDGNLALRVRFFVVAANGCKRHKGEEREFFEHKIKNFRGLFGF